jgi:phosphoribosyl 1,2-cyclic phosphodiesterase
MPNQESKKTTLSFWGVRGSIPSSPEPSEFDLKILNILKDFSARGIKNERDIKKYIADLPTETKYFIGSNTSCVHVSINGTHIIFDAGSGIRRLGEKLMQQEFGHGEGQANIFLSHTHWDHIMGFPYFKPAYKAGNNITIYGVHNSLEQRISTQQEDEYYPVSLSAMGANIDFIQLRKEETTNLNGIQITNKMLNHPGGSFGYRLDYKGKTIVYATDSEYKNLDEERMEKFIEFFSGADALIFDAQFTLDESIEKENWGHSTSLQGVNFAGKANVKHLLLFHHDPSYSEEKLLTILKDARKYADQLYPHKTIKISIAREGMELHL